MTLANNLLKLYGSQFWSMKDQKLWNKIKKKSLTQVLSHMNRYGITLGQTEDEMYLALLKNHLGFSFQLPNTMTKKQLLSFGVPEKEILRAIP